MNGVEWCKILMLCGLETLEPILISYLAIHFKSSRVSGHLHISLGASCWLEVRWNFEVSVLQLNYINTNKVLKTNKHIVLNSSKLITSLQLNLIQKINVRASYKRLSIIVLSALTSSQSELSTAFDTL